MGVSARKGMINCRNDKMFAGVFVQDEQSDNKNGNLADTE
jgi:hypothetical protein